MKSNERNHKWQSIIIKRFSRSLLLGFTDGENWNVCLLSLFFTYNYVVFLKYRLPEAVCKLHVWGLSVLEVHNLNLIKNIYLHIWHENGF